VAASTDAAGLLDDRQLVVIPRRTAAALDPEVLEAISAAVREGLGVLVEAPDSSLCRRIGLELAAVERLPRLPWPKPVASGVRRQLTLRPQPVEVAWTRLRYAPRAAPPEERPRVHLSLDGRPMGWTHTDGDGVWMALGLDLAELASRLRQGEDGKGLLAGQDHAWLDAWIEGIFGSAMTPLPLARVATTPPSADGWLVLGSPDPAGKLPDESGPGGWQFGTGMPSFTLVRAGRLLPHLEIPALHVGRADSLDAARLDRWGRRNSAGGSGPIRIDLVDSADDDLERELEALVDRRGHVEATKPEVLEWWTSRGDVRVFVEDAGETVDYRVDSIPPGSRGYGILVPISWRHRSLEGWDAGWGIAPGRRVQRYDRAYRLIELPPEAAGKRLRLRYR
jgi:hypothetical protein